ncbi:MAG: CusA/CzcA family heavy metal efflux RND transporter [Microscillaceae bacterium]
MIDRLIRFSIHNQLLILLLTFLWIGGGIYSLFQLPIDAVPDITNNQVQLITQSPNYSAQEIEKFITAPLELALANLQKVEEIRSISRFGISVITVVFRDEVDIYLARQWVTEQMSQVEIPPEMGQPAMTPVSTGLGEIYQYVLRPRPGYEGRYSAMELRTLQDWLVKRQLSGIEGVVDINSFGGKVKQYEVAIRPQELRAYNLSLDEVFAALQQNNQNTGGSYIEKNQQAYFIRGEGMLQSREDIAQTVIKTVAGVPVLVGHIAEVRLGSAVRYGAMSQEGKGEVVGGIVMMLKGANSAQVIARVKQRVAQVQKSLPEGVEIKAFLDRSELVGRAIGTVQTNLIEGGLIVIFVLVIFLGNVRAGLVVASVIPLALLFALAMMHLFGVSANLMSLGAIDFGLVVDGAVIIVEAIVHRLYHHFPGRTLSPAEMKASVQKSALQIRKSAAFGEIIILMVYVPIFSLTGIEGKMFGPMAQTVSFAILGALILSLTYVPAMSALVLRRKIIARRTFADRMVGFLQRSYQPTLRWALRHRGLVLGLTLALFLFSLGVFSRLGGEFIPQLDEGDLALEVRLQTGTSLSHTVEVSQKLEKILMQFPEVITVVSKIGTSEIPTDPMPIEANDLMVVLRDKSEWTSAASKDALIAQMEAALGTVPGVAIEFQQPIEMRFNELITGIKSDVAIKIYGEDLTVLAQEADKCARAIRGIAGVADLKVEAVDGLPQVRVRYRRSQLAQYGLKIEDVNRQLRMAFAGEVAGQVFEGEKRFDLVLRYAPEVRQDLQNLRNLYVRLPEGAQIPLQQMAEIEMVNAPVQISREDAQRRITVGLNVRGRDVESVVQDIQAALARQVSLPPGYYFTFGGQFENLRQAKERLMVAVPLALLLIFTLLYFTFSSLKQSLLIFSAIPLSAIGGVLALWLRGMPFSISAGVGFIALFGVAVLNGIVLIGYFNDLEEAGIRHRIRRILRGTEVRLRPVLMTATVASLGFLPMALSTGAGAEVQKPLATVVIGGLLSATALTLFVLPILYSWQGGRKEKSSKPPRRKPKAFALGWLLLVGLAWPGAVSAQSYREMNLREALDWAYAHHESFLMSQNQVEQAQYQARHAFTLEPFDVQFQFGNLNNAATDMSVALTQAFALPGFYRQKKSFFEAQTRAGMALIERQKNEMALAIKKAYFQWVFLREKADLLAARDSLLQQLLKMATLREQTGEASPLNTHRATLEVLQLKRQQAENQREMSIQEALLRQLLNHPDSLRPRLSRLPRPQEPLLLEPPASHPDLRWYHQAIEVQQAQKAWLTAQRKPLLQAGYFNMREGGTFNRHVLLAGIRVPLGRTDARNAQETADRQALLLSQEKALRERILTQEQEQWQEKMALNRQQRQYYEEEALPLARLIRDKTFEGYRLGELDYGQFAQSRQEVFEVENAYLRVLLDYHLLQAEAEYWQGIY